MSSMFGGDSSSKEYAPHMWIGDNFIGGTGKFIKDDDLGSKEEYYAGVTSKGVLVVEIIKKTIPWTETPVSESEIPEKVREQFTPNSFNERLKEEKRLSKLFNKEV